MAGSKDGEVGDESTIEDGEGSNWISDNPSLSLTVFTALRTLKDSRGP